MITNIFWEHYKKRDGAIYKDLAFQTHTERVEMLSEFIKNCENTTGRISNNKELYEQYKSLIGANKRTIRFYSRLKNYCNKNKRIPKLEIAHLTLRKMSGNNMLDKKIKYLNWLYKDWLNYRKYYKSIGFPMQETFIEYLQREIEMEGIVK